MKIFLTLALSLLLAACNAPASDPDKDADILAEESYRLVTGTKDLVDPIHGQRIGFWYGAMEGTEDTPANGVAYLHLFEDGTSSVTVNLNIALAPKGTDYVARARNSHGESVELGVLQSILGDARHSVQVDLSQDLSDYLFFEVIARSQSVETRIAEGTMKQPPHGTW